MLWDTFYHFAVRNKYLTTLIFMKENCRKFDPKHCAGHGFVDVDATYQLTRQHSEVSTWCQSLILGAPGTSVPGAIAKFPKQYRG